MDREKVINQIDVDIQRAERTGEMFVYVGLKTAKDALALLKEQEAIEPDVDVLNEIDRLYRCPKCHKHFLYRKQKYCDQCGQEVKWE